MFWKKRIYLDAAAGPAGNPSSPHTEGRRSRELLEGARTEIARLTEVKPDDVIFTSGATEANALAILSFAHPGAHLLYLPSAHASIVENMKLTEERGAIIEPLPIRDARVDIGALAKMFRPETMLVSMDAVCGETGVVWNTREVANVLRGHPMSKGHRMSTLLHVDASQAVLTEKITRAHFGADLLTLDGSKMVDAMRGPTHSKCDGRGIGALIAHRTIPLAAFYSGGGQERGLRPGSEAPELAEKFAACLRQAASGRAAFRARASADRARLVTSITSSIPNVFINEGRNASLPAGRQAPHILNLSLPDRDTDYLVALLDEAGFAVATRSACETDSTEGSRAVFALTGDRGKARSTLRISWNSATNSRDLDRFALALKKQVAFLDTASTR